MSKNAIAKLFHVASNSSICISPSHNGKHSPSNVLSLPLSFLISFLRIYIYIYTYTYIHTLLFPAYEKRAYEGLPSGAGAGIASLQWDDAKLVQVRVCLVYHLPYVYS